MGVANILNTGRSGLLASKVMIATTGHNIANANTEGYSRQRVHTSPTEPSANYGKNQIGTGTSISRIERVNDQYLEKQIREGQRDLGFFEEKEVALQQIENIFNEMSGDGLNRIISKFFNEFRNLAENPENPSLREATKESSQAMVNDFHRLRQEVSEVSENLDHQLAGYIEDLNTGAQEIALLNVKIQQLQLTDGTPNDLLDQRDAAAKKLAGLVDIKVHRDNSGNYNVDFAGGGPLVVGQTVEPLRVERTPERLQDGKPENALDIRHEGHPLWQVTHLLKGGRIGAVVEVRDHTVSQLTQHLDQLAFTLTQSVNATHAAGYTAQGKTGIHFFKALEHTQGAASQLELSTALQQSSSNIATALSPDAPGDNRVALKLADLQHTKLFASESATADQHYNMMVTQIGVAHQRNRFAVNQQKDIVTQLGKLREQISGVSTDEETTNLLQFQQAFDASAKVIQVADDLLKTVLSLKRD